MDSLEFQVNQENVHSALTKLKGILAFKPLFMYGLFTYIFTNYDKLTTFSLKVVLLSINCFNLLKIFKEKIALRWLKTDLKLS